MKSPKLQYIRMYQHFLGLKNNILAPNVFTLPLKFPFKANKHLKTKHEQLRARGEKYRKGRSCRQSPAQMPTANRQISKVTVQATGERSEVLEGQKSKDMASSVPSAFPGTENATRMISGCIAGKRGVKKVTASLFPLRKLPQLRSVRSSS